MHKKKNKRRNRQLGKAPETLLVWNREPWDNALTERVLSYKARLWV